MSDRSESAQQLLVKGGVPGAHLVPVVPQTPGPLQRLGGPSERICERL
jgi:hypothetical protein